MAPIDHQPTRSSSSSLSSSSSSSISMSSFSSTSTSSSSASPSSSPSSLFTSHSSRSLSPKATTTIFSSSLSSPHKGLIQNLFLLFLVLCCIPAPSLGRLPSFISPEVVDENNLAEGAPQPLSFPDVIRLLQNLQKGEEEYYDLKAQERNDHHSSRSSSRSSNNNSSEEADPRFIGITDGGLYRGDLVVYVPVTILLPTFGFRSRYSLAGKEEESDWFSYLFGSDYGRSYGGSTNRFTADIRGPVDRLLTNNVEYNPNLNDYKSQKDFGPLISRMDAYFHYLRVHDDDCRMRAICTMAKEPEKYAPLSYLVLSALKKSESFKRPSTYKPVVFRFMRYYWAAERGTTRQESCSHAYRKCPADLEDIVNMDVLRFWQHLASYVSIKLSDE